MAYLQAQVAAPQVPKHVPAFVVHELQGKRKVTKYRRNPETKTTESYQVEEPAGYMVSFPKGHSIRVRNLDELKRLGFDPSNTVPLLDEEGEVRATIPNHIRRGLPMPDDGEDELTTIEALTEGDDAAETTGSKK